MRGTMEMFQPHDLPQARRAATAVAAVAALVLLLFTAVTPGDASTGADLTVVATMLALALGLRLARPATAAALCLLTPVAGAAAVAYLDLLTDDATVAAQVFFCLPVLFAATHLRRHGAAVVLAAAVLGEAVVVGHLLPLPEALADLAYLSAVLVLTTVLLVRAGERQRALVERLRRQAATDPLTGLVTRRVLDDALGASLSSAGCEHGTSLVLLDLDRFKTINDSYGHPVGDEALELVGNVLQACSRPEDVSARMGGDELALLLPGCSYRDALARARAVVETVRDTPLPLAGGGEVTLSVSAGVAHAPDHAADVKALYAVADAALYRAKQSGRGRVVGHERVTVPAQSGSGARGAG